MELTMKELIEEYSSNLKRKNVLQAKLAKLKEYDTKITSNFSDTGGSSGSVSSKVERHIIKILETERQIRDIENDLYIVDSSQKVLNNKENEVIELIKLGYRNKLSKIAKVIGESKKYVFDTRNRAIKKMCEYIERG
jgi:DNA-binding CsgD family transcriptional regulator